jgi:hypothetical protein
MRSTTSGDTPALRPEPRRSRAGLEPATSGLSGCQALFVVREGRPERVVEPNHFAHARALWRGVGDFVLTKAFAAPAKHVRDRYQKVSNELAQPFSGVAPPRRRSRGGSRRRAGSPARSPASAPAGALTSSSSLPRPEERSFPRPRNGGRTDLASANTRELSRGLVVSRGLTNRAV